jgi:hypothetical protein
MVIPIVLLKYTNYTKILYKKRILYDYNNSLENYIDLYLWRFCFYF